MKKVNLLTQAATTSHQLSLQSVQLNESDLPVIFFTADGGEEDTHYCSEEAIRGFVVCNGADCILCRIGRKKEPRSLLPVYLPMSQSIGVLSMSTSLRPGALRPRVDAALAAPNTVSFIRKQSPTTFLLSTQPLPKDGDTGAAIIADFKRRCDNDEVSLDSVLLKYTNDQLRDVPEVKRLLALKEGVTNAGN